jgi:uncharacterized protein DUF4352
MHAWARASAGWIVPAAVLCASAACSGPLSAGDLWDRPAESSVRNAHATIAGSGDGVTFRGDGLVVFRPRLALSLHLQTLTGTPAELDVLEVGGATYQRAATDQKWARSSTSPPDPTWENATDPRLIGQDSIGGDRAWHLRATRGAVPIDMWVRQHDGYPLRLVTPNGKGATFTFTFDRFNTGVQVDAPPPVQLKPAPRSLRGGVGDSLALNAARLTVPSVDDDAQSDDDLVVPRPGNRFVVVEVLVENIGSGPLSTFFDWRLADAKGFAWDQALAVRQPSFEGGELDPGEYARGFLTYEVSRSATSLTLTVKVDGDTAAFALG